MRTIEDVLDEMIGANYMLTQQQIDEIKYIHAEEKQRFKTRIVNLINEAYDSGRKHDASALQAIVKHAEDLTEMLS